MGPDLFAVNRWTSHEPRIYQLLVRLRERGGALVRADDCPIAEVAIAEREGRHTIDADGFAYVLRTRE